MSFILNPQQKEAIHYLDGPLLVLAGAGSGKTRVITQKIAYLILECGYQPRNIAAITFTNKAAKEMHERIGKALSRTTADQIQISTFHSLGVRILREEAKALGYKPRFSIFDSADCGGILADLAKTVDKNSLKAIQSIISNWKNGLINPEMARKIAVDEETVRLRSHLNQLDQMLTAGGPIGRKLDFLLQEFNRESNTIGSKGNDIEQARNVVEIKAEAM